MNTPLQKLLREFGSQSAVAEALELTSQAVQQWKYIPEKWALDVERLTRGKITAADVLRAARAHRKARQA